MSWLVKKSVLVPIDFSKWSYEAIAPAREYVESETYLTLIQIGSVAERVVRLSPCPVLAIE